MVLKTNIETWSQGKAQDIAGMIQAGTKLGYISSGFQALLKAVQDLEKKINKAQATLQRLSTPNAPCLPSDSFFDGSGSHQHWSTGYSSTVVVNATQQLIATVQNQRLIVNWATMEKSLGVWLAKSAQENGDTRTWKDIINGKPVPSLQDTGVAVSSPSAD